MSELEMHQVQIRTDGGPWADHSMPCPVCQRVKAVLYLNGAYFEPCYFCESNGWMLIHVRRKWLRKRIVEWMHNKFRKGRTLWPGL